MVSGSWMQRQTPNMSNLGFRNQEVSVQWRPNNQLGWTNRAGVSHFELGGLNYFDGLSYATWYEWRATSLEAMWSAVGPQDPPQSLSLRSGVEVTDISGNGSALAASENQIKASKSSQSGGRSESLPSNSGNDPKGVVCHYLGGLELDRRSYLQDSSQNGAYAGAMLGGLCSSPTNQLSLTLQDGLDRAVDSQRAGGNQQRQEFKAQWLHALGQHRLGLEWGQQRLLDSQIYSELLGSVVRNTLRQNIRLSLDYKIAQNLGMMGGSLHWVSFWENLHYRSSVDLFNLKGQSFQSGVKWDF
jgi:hypothetical protein